MEPFIVSESGTDNDEDEEVFFGKINDKERSKMAKLRRKTQVFVANFRDMSSSGSAIDSLDESNSTHHSAWSHGSSEVMSSTEPESPTSSHSSHETEAATQHPTPLDLERLASSSADSPSVLAHRAAAKIQTWFRLTRQTQEYQGVMREVERLEAKTDDFIQKIRREKERIQQCSTPEQGGRLDTGSLSPVVIVPTHRLHLVATSPQQDSVVTSLEQSLRQSHLSPNATDVVFNATNDNDSIHTSSVPTPTSPDELDESISEFGTTQSEVPPAESESTSTEQSCGTPDRYAEANQGKTDASVGSSLQSTSSAVQVGSACQLTSVANADSLYHVVNSKVDSDVKAEAKSGEFLVGSPIDVGNSKQNAKQNANSPFMQIGNSSVPYKERTPLRQLQLSGILSSTPKVPYEQIQSPTVFSSPRLFPTTVQSVQLQQSLPPTALFSPLKISDHKPVKDYHHSEMSMSFSAKVTEPKISQRELGKENYNSVFDIDPHQPKTLISASVRQDLDYHACPNVSNFTLSTPVTDLPVSPRISVLRSGQKFAIITPNSPLLANTSRSAGKSYSVYESEPIADEGSKQQLRATQVQGRQRNFFPSPVVPTRDTPVKQTPSVSLTNPTAESAPSRLAAAYPGQPGVSTPPFTGLQSSESARRKVELLEQKRAELARLRAEKAELKQTLKTENEMCFAMKQEVQAALRSNTSHTNIPVHLLSLGCQGVSSLTLNDQELDMVTRLHTIRNSQHDNLQGLAASPMVTPTPHKGLLHLQWHSDLVTEVHHLSSPGHAVRVARPILANQDFCKARRVPTTKASSPAQRVPIRQDKTRFPSGHTRTPREKLAF